MSTEPKSPLFSNVWYDRVNFLTRVVLPGLATLYFTLAMIWGLPKAEEVVGTVAGLVTFLGLLLQVSSSRYAKGGGVYDGEVVKVPVGGEMMYAIQFDTESVRETAHNKDVLSLKIRS